MRLQLSILRHALPPIQILCCTGTGPSSHTRSRDSTIADLLNDVNDLVPLESADGEWGLEDYVVEVGANPGQDDTYECLHFQTCESVLREDDEVVIRALSSDDLRARRLGGRHQISADGRHLIDGVAFGKQWLRKSNRPGIVIPPRKRRRILAPDEDPAGDDDELQLLLPPLPDNDGNALVPFEEDEDEHDEDDGEYHDDADLESPRLQITMREDFDDVDEESGPDASDEISNHSDLNSELQLLLEDAADIADARTVSASHHILEKKLKRKRDLNDDGDDDPFEGFSTPVRTAFTIERDTSATLEDGSTDDTTTAESSKLIYGYVVGSEEDAPDTSSSSGTSRADSDADSMMDELASQEDAKRAKNLLADDENEDDSDSDASFSSETSSESDADSMLDDIAVAQAKKRALNLLEADDTTSDDNFTADSTAAEDEDDPTSSSASDSSSTSSAWDSGSDAASEISNEEPSGVPVTVPSTTASPATPRTVAPGCGLARTRHNNARAKRRRELVRLKEDGVLSPDADFRALAEYQHRQAAAEAGSRSMNGHVQNDVRLPEPPVTDALSAPDDAVVVASEQGNDVPESDTAAPSPKRAKLDLASSRRMVFSSLGLRVPKTPEAEQALREQLAHPRREAPPLADALPNVPTTDTGNNGQEDHSWKDKLIVKAVECEGKGGALPPPPFPFQQRWTKPSHNKRQAKSQDQYYEDSSILAGQENQGGVNAHASAPTPSNGQFDHSAGHPHITETADSKTPPLLVNFDELPALDPSDIHPGAVVAYKELHVDASTNYQPQVSPYRVGRVSQLGDDSNVHLQLDPSCFTPAAAGRGNANAGDQVYDKFELQIDGAEDVIDDGTRQVPFSHMISAKLVQASAIEVPNSHGDDAPGDSGPPPSRHDSDVVVPESKLVSGEAEALPEPQLNWDEISSPRRHEIDRLIKEAGFDSALDEELLEPLAPVADEAGNDDGLHVPSQSQGEYPHRFRRRSPRVNRATSNVVPSSEVEDEAEPDDDPTSEPARSSSPFVHTLDTVDYPHISQMDLQSSMGDKTANSSSHQDAQKPALRLTAEVPYPVSEMDRTVAGELDGPEHDEDHRDSSEYLRSQVSPSPSQEVAPNHDQTPRSSFLGGAGYDGQDSSDRNDESSDDDYDSLPSLRELISSQRSVPERATQSHGPTTSSPPPIKRALRTAARHHSATPSDTSDFPPSSQTRPKDLQSQPGLRLSQIPAGSQLVDLTGSSPAAGLSGDDDEDATWAPRREKGSPAHGTRKPAPRAAKRDAGIGKRRLLTTKKSREYY